MKGWMAVVALCAAVTAAAAAAQDSEAVARIQAAKPAGVPLVADPIDLSQPSAPVWFRGDRPQNAVFAKVVLRPLGGAVPTGQPVAGTPALLLRAVAGDAPDTAAAALAASGPLLFCGKADADALLCLEDGDRDGRFEASRRGIGGGTRTAETLEIVGPAEPLPQPLAYRAATSAELPHFDAVIEQCARDYDRPRFSYRLAGGAEPDKASVLAALNGRTPDLATLSALLRGSGRCEQPEPAPAALAAGIEPGGRAVVMRDLVVGIGAKERGAPSRLLRVARPDRLYRLDGTTVVALAGEATASQDALAAKQKFPRPVFAATGPATVAEGVHGAGEVVATVGFRHGYTGRLLTETKIRTLLSSRSLPAGTLLYGVPMQTSMRTTINGIPQGFSGPPRPTAANTNLVWCVPVQDDAKWSATCLPTQGGNRYTLLKGQAPAFEVTSLTYNATTSTNDGATPVAEQPGDFGRPLLYRFTVKAITPAAIVLTQDTLFGDEVVFSRPLNIARLPGQVSAVTLGSEAVTFADAENGRISVGRAGDAAKAGDALTVDSGILRARPDAG